MRSTLKNAIRYISPSFGPIHQLVLVALIFGASQAHAGAPSLDTSNAFQTAVSDLKRLSFERPNSATLRLAQRRALTLATQMQDNLLQQSEEAKNNSSLTKDQKSAIQATVEQSLKWINQQMDEARMPVRGVVALDPSAPATGDNLAQVDLHIDPATREQLVQERDATRGSNGMNLLPGIKHFSTQYVTYGAASFLMSVSQLGLNYQTNPAALDQWAAGFRDPVGATGFYFFMAVNHPVGVMLDGVIKGKIPRMMIPYIGLMAGSLGSTVFHDLYADVDFHKCFTSHFGAVRDDEACNRSYDHWVLSNLIVKYSPNLISMVASQMVADAGRAAISAGIKKSAQVAGSLRERAAANVVFRGLSIRSLGVVGRLAQAGSTVVAGAFTPGGFIVGGVQFVAFLYLDSKLGEPLARMKDTWMLNTFNVSSWLNKMGFHRDFFLTPKGATQMIANALDVEATDLYSAHQYLMQEYGILAANGWNEPNRADKCVPLNMQNKKMSDFAAQPVTVFPTLFDGFRIADRWLNYSKSNDQLRCEVLARPNDLFDRYTQLNKTWRTDIILGPFEQKKQNWTMMIGNFFTQFDAAHNLAQYLADAKFKFEKTGERPDLSRDALEKVVKGSGESTDGETADSGQSDPSVYGVVGRLRTPTKLDQALASLACGPDSRKSSLPAVSTIWNRATSYFQGSRTSVNSPYVGTRFGGAFYFKAPNLTTGNGSICNDGENRMKAAGSSDPLRTFQGSSQPTFDTTDVVTGKFYERKTGKVYNGLAEYVFENMNPAVYQRNADFSNFSNYWTDVQTSIETVWTEYGKMYDQLVREDYLPVAFKRDFSRGCNTKTGYDFTPVDSDGLSKQTRDGKNGQEQCADSSAAYRVGNGQFLAIEIELRNYIRGLYSLNTGLYQGENTARLKVVQHDFLTVANELISQVNGLKLEKMKDPDDLTTYIQVSLTQVQSLKELIEARMNEMKEPADSFRRKTLDQLVKAAGGLIAEQEDSGKTLHLMDFEDANSRPSGNSSNTKKAFNPYSHGG